MDNIICPHCKKTIALSDAIVHELSEKVRNEEKQKQKIELDKIKIQIEKETEEKFRQENKKELDKANKNNEELEKKLTENLEKQQKNEEKIREEALKEAQSNMEVKMKQKDIQLEQVRKANEELNRKLNQNSQQLQGEALEQNLEEKLKNAFQNDEFVPVPKGVEGGDIWQKVKFNGKVVGSILWETKRTKAWSNGWLTKLKDDASKISANEAILVSQVLPDGVTTFDRKDGVWITSYELAINICRYVRYLITALSKAKSSISHSDEEWAKLRDYMLSEDFKHRMRTHFESVKTMKEYLVAEEKAAKLRWKKQTTLLDKLDNNTYDFYVDLKNIVPNLPEIENVETPLLEDENDEDEQESLL